MPHCRNCGNPVRRSDTECNICRASLKPGAKQTPYELRYDLGPQFKPARDQPPRQEASSQHVAPSFPAQSSYARQGHSSKLLVYMLILAIVVPLLIFGLLALIDFSGDLLPHGTPQGEITWVSHIDDSEVQATFSEFQPATRFVDCRFSLSIGGADETFDIQYTGFSHFIYYGGVYLMLVLFVDLDADGFIDAGDYCTISSDGAPTGVECSISIIYASTGGTICSGVFQFL